MCPGTMITRLKYTNLYELPLPSFCSRPRVPIFIYLVEPQHRDGFLINLFSCVLILVEAFLERGY